MLAQKNWLDLFEKIWQQEMQHLREYVQTLMFLSMPGMTVGITVRRSVWWWLISTVVFIAGAVVLQELDYRKTKTEENS